MRLGAGAGPADDPPARERAPLTRREYLAAHAPITAEDVARCYGSQPNLNNDTERRAYLGTWALMAVEYADLLAEVLDGPKE